MIAYNFHPTARNEAGSPASEGLRKLPRHADRVTLLNSLPVHPARPPASGEQRLIDQLRASVGADYPRDLLTDYYVSLKTNPLVALSGPKGTGKNGLVEGFARAVIGPSEEQFITISGMGWGPEGTQRSYYQGLYERFGSFRFLEALQEAAAPGNLGRIYLVFFKGLLPDEVDVFFRHLLSVGPDGEKRLALPGMALHEQPILPPNVFITATLHVPQDGPALDHEIIRQAGLITFSATHRPAPAPAVVVPPPVGFQRLMLLARVRGPAAARARLEAILGPEAVRALGPSEELGRTLWSAGAALNRAQRDSILTYVANSFDTEGQGLFDPADPLRNARVAFDAQIVQRVLWQLPDHGSPRVRRLLAARLAARGC